MEINELIRSQRGRWKALDNDLPDRVYTPPADDIPTVTSDGAQGYAHHVELGPDDVLAALGPLNTYFLRAVVEAVSPAEVTERYAALLSSLLPAVREQYRDAMTSDAPSNLVPPAHEHVLRVNWPSRETAVIPALRAHGFAPTTTVALRMLDHHRPPSHPIPAAIRTASMADLDGVVDVVVDGLMYDEAPGITRPRESMVQANRESYEDKIANQAGSVFVAELHGEIIGVASVMAPEHAEWVQGFTSIERPGYFASLAVREGQRGTGLGSALVRAGHGYLQERGVRAVILHHGTLNPLSTPFYYKRDYRPLWTTWQAPLGPTTDSP